METLEELKKEAHIKECSHDKEETCEYCKDVIAGVNFKPAIDSLESITGSKLSDMLGRKNIYPNAFISEQEQETNEK